MMPSNNVCFSLYTKKVMEHFKNPHNKGSIKNADGIGQVDNSVCGDAMFIYIKVAKNKKRQEIIKDIKFKTFGCVAAISTSSVVTDLAKGKTIENALKITKNDVVRALGALPKVKYHCSILAVDALGEAIYDYYKKNPALGGIPEDAIRVLQKRHEVIQKTKEIMEKRYKNRE